MSRRRRRNPQREQFWRDAVAAWKESGQSVRVFCAGRGLHESSFYGWRRAFGKPDRLRPVALPTLVPLRVVADAVLEVVLPTGLVVRVPSGADAVAVSKLIAALGTTSC
jgi:hypothetical protein